MTTAIFMGLFAIAKALTNRRLSHENVLWITMITDLCIVAALVKWVLFY